MDDRFNQINKILREEIKKNYPQKTKKRWPWLAFVFLIVLVFIFFSIFLFGEQTDNSPQKIVIKKIKKTGATIKATLAGSSKNLFPYLDQPTNFLFLGMPGQGNDAPELTDTIVLALYNPQQKKITLISLPRDFWVQMPSNNEQTQSQECQPLPTAEEGQTNIDECQIKQGSGYFTKINSLYVLGKRYQNENYGLELIKQKVEEITGQPIDYYVLLDLTAVKQVIERLGGLNINIPQDIYDPSFPGPNHSFEIFEIKAGWRYLDGETALKYIRTRHTKTGDFERMGRQQQVLQAIKQKVMGLNPIWDLPSLIKIFDDLQSHMKTNLALGDSFSLWQTAKLIAPENIKTIVIDTSPENGLLIANHIPVQDKQAYVVQPKAGLEDYSQIQKFIEENK